jgi:hypothetical protein
MSKPSPPGFTSQDWYEKHERAEKALPELAVSPKHPEVKFKRTYKTKGLPPTPKHSGPSAVLGKGRRQRKRRRHRHSRV